MGVSKRTAGLIGAAMAIVALAFFLGRTTAPEKIKTIEVSAKSDIKTDAKADTKQEAATSSKTTAGSFENDKSIEWTDTKVYRPNGKLLKETKTAKKADSVKQASATTEATASTKSEAHVEVRTETKTEYVYREKVVESAKPRWSAGAMGGVALGLKPHYGPAVGFRLIGGLWLDGTVDVPARAALVTARFTF